MDLFLTIMLTIVVGIGYVLGAILLLVLLVVAVVLFVPIRYRVYGERTDTNLAFARVSWLLSAVSYELTYVQKPDSAHDLQQQIRILGRKWGEKAPKEKKPKKRKQRKQEPPQTEQYVVTPTEETPLTPTESIPVPDLTSTEEESHQVMKMTETPPLEQPVESVTPPEPPKPKPKPSLTKLEKTLNQYRRKARRTHKKITTETKKYKRALKRLNRLPRKRRILKLLRRFGKKLTRRLKPEYLNLSAEIGIGAFNTGRLLAAVAVLLPELSPSITGNFDEQTIKGKISVGGRIKLSHLALPALGLYLKKDIRNAIKYITAVIKPLL